MSTIDTNKATRRLINKYRRRKSAGGMRMMNNALCISDRAVELQLRLCVEAHCRSTGHRAKEATLGAIKEYVAWTTIKVPRPLATELHATKLIVVLHFDSLYIGLSTCGKYLYDFSLKNDLSGHLWPVPCRTADAEATVHTLMRWFAVFR
jgi:hypothetical protein